MKMLFFDADNNEKIFLEQQNLCDFDVIYYDGSFTEVFNANLLINDVDIICISEKSILNSETLSKFSNLRVIASRSRNFSNIDLEYCINNRIAVITPGETECMDTAECVIKSLINSIKDYNKGLYVNRLC